MSTNGFSHSIKPATDRAIKYFRSIIPEGQTSPGKATEAYRNVDELAYLLSQVPMGTPRKVKIIASGAGFSGLAIARAVNIGQIPNAELKVYEKNSAPGGTWWENRYPGCACDIPAHNYQFSWAPNPYWKSFYASRDDIQDYFNAVVEQHDLRKYIETSRKIVGAKWLEDRQVWEVTVSKTDGRELVPGSFGATDGETGETFVEECDIFVNSSGFFNAWKWPDVPGRETFKGRTLHSAAWPEDGDKDIDGKTVSLIGNGSSGVQLLPAIIKRAKKVYVHIRSPTWITTGIAEQFAGPGGSNLWFSEEQKREWAEQPEKHLAYRKKIEATMNSRFGLYIDHTPAQKAAREFSENEMKKKLSKAGKEELIKLMMPDFAVGCRRPTPGNGYLEALGEPNCEVVWGDVDCFTPNGLRTQHNGVATETEADTIICATGFDLSMAPRFPVIGRHGVDLRERWLKNPDSYLSVTTSDMPNYFTFMGPSSPLGHGSLVTSIEFVCTYVCDLIKKLQTENYASLCPKPGVSEAYQRHALAWLEKTAWASSCTSTYKNGNKDGKLVSLHPGSRLHYFKLLATHRYEDFEWTSLCEDPDLRFAWMASGFTYDETMRAEEVDLTSFCNPDEHMKPVVTRSQARAEMNGKL